MHLFIYFYFSGAEAYSRYQGDPESSPVHLSVIQCSGLEESLVNCSRGFLGEKNIYCTEILGVGLPMYEWHNMPL